MVTARVRSDANRRTRDSMVTIGTVVGLVAAMALTLFGLGAAEHAVAGHDASSWLWSSAKSEVARVNGITGRVDTRYQIPDSVGHPMQVTQTDRYLVLRDQSTGLISAIDLTTLQIAATAPSIPGIGVTVALHGDAVFVVDAVQGIVRQLDPLTLTAVGDAVRFPPGITGGVFDGDGLLWIAVPTEGTVVAVRPAPRPSGGASGGAGGGASGGAGGTDATPREARTEPVAEPNHDLAVSALDNGVAALDRTTDTLTTLRGRAVRHAVLDLTGPGAMPARISGRDVPVTVVDDRHVYVVNGGRVYDFTVPGEGAKLRPCVAWAGRFYCPDDATGTIYAIGQTGRLLDSVAVPNAGGPLELEVRERHLFVNAPHSSTARVVDEHHRVRVVDKYANQILGGDPPPSAPPRKPAAGKPGAPSNVTASAGDATARVTWGPAPANGAAITRYVVTGGPKPLTVGANQRSVEVTGLANGQTYRFSVHAVNAKGTGPARTSNPVVPTSDVPDPPASVAAKADPDGTVTLTWPAADGLGRPIVRYAVTAISAAGSAEIGGATGTSLTLAAGKLEYGTQYAFTVVSINDKGAGSKPSPTSNTVVPYTKPSAVRSLSAAAVPTQRGAVRATWRAADDNGRPITGYVVSAGRGEQTVTGTAVTLTGFADGQSVTVTVKAVNAAGTGPAASATARTIAPPTVTVTGRSGATNSITVSLSTDAGGGTVTCQISVESSPPVPIGCGGGTVGGLWPGNTYAFTVTATNAAGGATARDSVTTPPLRATVTCPKNTSGYCDAGIWAYRSPSQQGTAVPPALPVGTRFVAQCRTRGNTTVDATPWGGKRTDWWLRFDHSGTAYFPWAWAVLDGGDNLSQLPTC